MKTFRIIVVICFLLVLLGSLALFIFTQTFDAKRFKTQLSAQLSQQIGRKVEMGKLDLSFSLFRGLFLSVQKFNIMDDEAFSQNVLLGIAGLKLDINILTFLTQKKVVISTITVDSPQLNLVRNEEGLLNVSSIAKEPSGHSSDERKDQYSAGNSKTSSSAKKATPNLPQVLVRSLQIEKGKLTFTDKVQSPQIRIELTDITFDVAGLSSTAPFKFTLESSLWSREHNLKIRGQGQLNLKNLQVRLDDVSMNVDLSSITLSELEKGVPTLKSSEWDLAVQGKMETLISQMVVGQDGLLLLSGAGKVTLDQVDLRQIPLSVKGTIDYEISEKDVQVREVSLATAGGTLTGQARIDDYLKEQKYFSNIQSKDIALTKYVPELGPQATFHGNLNGHLKLEGQGFRPDKVLSALKGEAQLNIQQGMIDNFNILRFMLSKITTLPRLDEVLIAKLPEESRKKLEQKGTIFDKIDFMTTLKEEKVIVDRAELNSSAFSVTAKGQVDMERNMNFTATLYIPKDLSEQMITVVEELKVLQDEDGRLSIPVKTYSGLMSGFRIFPDSEALARKLTVGKSKEHFKELLQKVLYPDSNTGSPSGTPQGGQRPIQRNQELPDKTINSILNSILK